MEMLSVLSQSRIKDKTIIPSQLEKGCISLAAVKKFSVKTDHIGELICQ